MYLISIYFDPKTNKKIQQYINKVARQTGNTFMLDGNVPPHITISAFETIDEQAAISLAPTYHNRKETIKRRDENGI